MRLIIMNVIFKELSTLGHFSLGGGGGGVLQEKSLREGCWVPFLL